MSGKLLEQAKVALEQDGPMSVQKLANHLNDNDMAYSVVDGDRWIVRPMGLSLAMGNSDYFKKDGSGGWTVVTHSE